MLRHEIINMLIQKNNYKSYLEIGLDDAANFKKINCELKESVDPFLDLKNNFSNGDSVHYNNGELPNEIKNYLTYRMSSDDLFKTLNKKYDIIFIDGLHTEEQVGRDIINSLKHLNKNGKIVVHDCLPPRKECQIVPRICGEWNGDVWKAITKLAEQNIQFNVIESDYGCCIIDYFEDADKLNLLDKSDLIYENVFLDNSKRNKILHVISTNQFLEKYINLNQIRQKTKFNNIRVCVVTNRFLDEEYIEEWCEHYYNLGFNFIYILEDINGRNEYFIDMPYIKDKVEKGIMQIEQIPHRNQWDTYPIFYEKHKTEFDWCGIYDSDEFLVLNKHNNIYEYLNDEKLNFKDADVIQINLRNYTDNNQLYKTKGKIVDRFTEKAQYKDKIETKILIRGNLQNVKFFIGHAAISNNNNQRIKFSDGSIIGVFDPFHKTNYEYATLEHYYCKSTEEYIKRKSIGRLDVPSESYKKALQDFKESYFNISKRTIEKEKMFNEALQNLK